MNQRLERINQLIRDEIADILRRDIHDPLIGFVTITEVEVSPDLRFAKVFYSVLGSPEQIQASIKGILRARKYINARIAERIDLRYIPKLRFILDETAARAQQMETLLHKQHDEFGEAIQENETLLQAPDEHFDPSGRGGEDEEDFDGEEDENDFEDEDDEDDFAEEDDEVFGDPDAEETLNTGEDVNHAGKF